MAFYGIAFAVIVMLNSFAGSFMGAMLPALSRAPATQLPAMLQKASYVMLVLAVPIATGGICSGSSLSIYLLARNTCQQLRPWRCYSAASCLRIFNSVFGYACVAIGRVDILMWVQLPAIVFNIALNILGIPRYGIEAAAFATLVAEVVSFAATSVVFRKRLRMRLSLGGAWKPLVAASLMVGVSLLGSSLWQSRPAPLSLISGVGILGVIYALGLIALKGVPEDAVLIAVALGRRSLSVGVVRRLVPRRRALHFQSRGGQGPNIEQEGQRHRDVPVDPTL